MKFRHELTYAAPPAEVYAMLADRAFRERVCQEQGVVSAEITLTPSGEGFELVSDQVQDTAGLPSVARKITGDTTRAVVTERWAGPSGGTVEIDAPGKPTRVTGRVTLEETPTGTREVVELDVSVKVPLVGGKLEKLMADTIGAGLDVEQSVGNAWLEGER